MKSFALPLALVVIAAAALVTKPADGASGQIIIGPLRVVINGGGPLSRPKYVPSPRPNFVPNRNYVPVPNGYYPQPGPQPAPRPAPQPAPVAAIPASLQGNWVERFANGDIWYHNLTAGGQHIVTTVPVGGQASSVTSQAIFSQGSLTISNGAFAVSSGSNGSLTLSRTGVPTRTWTRNGTPTPQPAPAPANMVNLVGTWYEHQQAADGSPVLFRYDLNADGSYDMFKYAQDGSGNWDLDNPTAHLGARTSADARPWTFDGQNLTLAAGQPYAEGPLKYAAVTGGIHWTSSKGDRNWSKEP